MTNGSYTQDTDAQEVPKIPTGIDGFDFLGFGGLPEGRTTLVSGSSGSAKTVFACQFVAEGVRRGEPGVFVTFEETPESIRRNMLGFGWDIKQWEEDGLWAFVDASPDASQQALEVGDFDLGALIARVEHAVRRVGAVRLSVDSIGALFHQFLNEGLVRRELFRVVAALKDLGLTSVLTAERVEEFGPIGRYGVEEFVTDNVIVLRNLLEEEKRRRTVEILKFRGAAHQKGEFPFSIQPGRGLVFLPLSALELKQTSSEVRVSSGVEGLDVMCGGGFFRDSVVLVSGATGTGKTLLATTFMGGGTEVGERCLLFAYEESREQLFRNARGWGIDFEEMERKGLLKVVCEYPETRGLEDHLIRMRSIIDEFQPQRLAVDSFSALERISTHKSFREFVVGLTSFVKHRELTALFTSTTPELLGGSSITDAHISTITDSIILLRYVEFFGMMRRGLTVLKMRGSMHDKDIREFGIDGEGMHIGEPFRNVSGILSGSFQHRSDSELERMAALMEQIDP